MKLFYFRAPCYKYLVLFFLVISLSGTVCAQMMPEPKPAASHVEKEGKAPLVTRQVTDDDVFANYWNRFMGEQSPYRPIILSILTLLILLQVRGVTTKWIKGYVNDNALMKDNAHAFMRMWSASWFFIIAVLVVI